ncbi:hypothetical protein PR202_ga29450 [Eleusine coracana subsp. coracana]|uniref:Uncharacterized protein n=1 Tax=Eleusine coracana subsp. coracana TaxID=191504 RepID=A0AAV5DM36_ELECO|nr:hypothetical protein PR202_ga29450 [Eleusine coracana subsp. coracana]
MGVGGSKTERESVGDGAGTTDPCSPRQTWVLGRDPLDIEDNHRHRARVDVEDATASSGGKAADAFAPIIFLRT